MIKLFILGLLLSDPLLISEIDKHIPKSEIEGKKILEVGSRDINGTVRPVFERKGCAYYLGTDIEEGQGVDSIINVHDLHNYFEPESFDIVVCLETLEHIEDWSGAVLQMLRVLKVGGLIVVSAPQPGFKKHEWPGDYWRYTLDNWREIFYTLEEVYATNINDWGTLYIARKVYEIDIINIVDLYEVTDKDIR